MPLNLDLCFSLIRNSIVYDRLLSALFVASSSNAAYFWDYYLKLVRFKRLILKAMAQFKWRLCINVSWNNLFLGA